MSETVGKWVIDFINKYGHVPFGNDLKASGYPGIDTNAMLASDDLSLFIRMKTWCVENLDSNDFAYFHGIFYFNDEATAMLARLNT